MSSEYVSDVKEWYSQEPDGYLRLHHFADKLLPNRMIVQGIIFKALIGTEVSALLPEIDQEATGLVDFLSRTRAYAAKYPRSHWDTTTNYFIDRYGNKSHDEIYRDLVAHASYAYMLGALPDSAVLELGAHPDVICDTCALGQHCRAADQSSYLIGRLPGMDHGPHPSIEGELLAARIIEAELRAHYPEPAPGVWTRSEELLKQECDDGSEAYFPAPVIRMTMGVLREIVRPAECSSLSQPTY